MNQEKFAGRSWSGLVIAASILFGLLGLCPEIQAQGPSISYYYQPQTELSWARCDLYMQGGSRQRIPFLPVVCSSFEHAPMGSDNYNKDIAADGPIVFIGNGISKAGTWDSYAGRRTDYTIGPIDVSGSIVLLCPDFADVVETKVGRDFPLSRRIAEAALRKAAAVVVFSSSKAFPFLAVRYETKDKIPNIPVITITKDSATNILNSAGLEGEAFLKDWAASGKPPESQVLISRLSLTVKGKFDKVETGNFLFRYLIDTIPARQMNELAEVNEKALVLLRGLFGEEKNLRWRKLPVFYFRDYDSKVFYTHHWGSGWATGEGTYMVHKGGAPNLPLAAHENAHILIDLNWGGSSSFLSEGIGKYAEAQAGDPDKNNRQTIDFLKGGKLFPLKEMVSFAIGNPGPKTDVGYPAAGSFVEFLIQTRGLEVLKEAYISVARTSDGGISDGPWLKALGKPLQDLEGEWLEWLAQSHKDDARAIRRYLERRTPGK